MESQNQTSVEDDENRNSLMDDKKQTSLQAQREEKTSAIPKEMGLTDMECTKKEFQSRDIDMSTANPDKGSGLTACISEACGPAKKSDNQTNGENVPDTEVYNPNFMKFKNQISRSPENKLLEVYFSNPNYNNCNKTEYSYNKSYLIVSGNGDGLPIDTGIDDAIR